MIIKNYEEEEEEDGDKLVTTRKTSKMGSYHKVSKKRWVIPKGTKEGHLTITETKKTSNYAKKYQNIEPNPRQHNLKDNTPKSTDRHNKDYLNKLCHTKKYQITGEA